MRDFAYVRYSKMNGRVTAKTWYGYPALLTGIFLPYYFMILFFVVRIDKFHYLGNKNYLFLYSLAISLLSPLVAIIYFMLRKLQEIKPLYLKSASVDYNRKQKRGFGAMIVGWGFLALFFSIMNQIEKLSK
ncbi:hypothetical protein [Telluribacter sp. SYSU D00476]|uniref:hypothetical protein n=1 Tax=Telluribacter sp. SYSU D00476 TaxID=2811430 RepID=UPI001FF5CAB4|nr:hypothetical protein [Telluribacter sp. SYSU D00476]